MNTNSTLPDGIEWLYSNPTHQTNQEDFLLGKPIPGANTNEIRNLPTTFPFDSNVQTQESGTALMGTRPNQETLRRLREDPHFIIKQLEMQQKRLMENHPLLALKRHPKEIKPKKKKRERNSSPRKHRDRKTSRDSSDRPKPYERSSKTPKEHKHPPQHLRPELTKHFRHKTSRHSSETHQSHRRSTSPSRLPSNNFSKINKRKNPREASKSQRPYRRPPSHSPTRHKLSSYSSCSTSPNRSSKPCTHKPRDNSSHRSLSYKRQSEKDFRAKHSDLSPPRHVVVRRSTTHPKDRQKEHKYRNSNSMGLSNTPLPQLQDPKQSKSNLKAASSVGAALPPQNWNFDQVPIDYYDDLGPPPSMIKKFEMLQSEIEKLEKARDKQPTESTDKNQLNPSDKLQQMTENGKWHETEKTERIHFISEMERQQNDLEEEWRRRKDKTFLDQTNKSIYMNDKMGLDQRVKRLAAQRNCDIDE